MLATTQTVTSNVNAENNMDWAISSQAPWRQGEGSTTRLHGLKDMIYFEIMKTPERPTTKLCKDCNQEKSFSEFTATHGDKYRFPYCKPCAATRQRVRLQDPAYREKSRANGRKWREANREQIKERMAVYRQENAERLAEYRKMYYAEHQAEKLSTIQSRRQDPAYRERERARAHDWKKRNSEQVQEYMVAWRQENADRVAEYRKTYYANHQDYFIDKSRAYREANPEQHLAAVKRWAANHPEQYKISKRKGYAKRRAVKKQAAVAWANQEAILQIYALAEQLTAETGIQHHVDHIVPLTSNLVCGLHWEGNLQVLTAAENMRKHNKLMM